MQLKVILLFAKVRKTSVPDKVYVRVSIKCAVLFKLSPHLPQQGVHFNYDALLWCKYRSGSCIVPLLEYTLFVSIVPLAFLARRVLPV